MVENESGMDLPIQEPTVKNYIDLFMVAKNNWIPAIMKYKKFAMSKYFYNEKLIKAFLFKTTLENVGKSEFIDYDSWRSYYPDKLKLIKECNGEEVPLSLPYEEICNFIQCTMKMAIGPEINKYNPPGWLHGETESAKIEFETQPSKKGKIFDGPIVRLKQLSETDDGYVAELERSTYFEQVRTNLTLDYDLEAGDTLRTRDLDSENENRLKSFDESIMVNSIGVSSVVYFKKKGERYYFMKLRKESEGIYENMFGSTSGVAQLPEGLPATDLLQLAASEMLREFFAETGLKNDAMSIVRIKPLSFTRDLVRGGKPQFFFEIEIPEQKESEFGEKFKTSDEGLEEFANGPREQYLSYSKVLSPEFFTNLYYSMQADQVNRGLSSNPIVFDI